VYNVVRHRTLKIRDSKKRLEFVAILDNF